MISPTKMTIIDDMTCRTKSEVAMTSDDNLPRNGGRPGEPRTLIQFILSMMRMRAEANDTRMRMASTTVMKVPLMIAVLPEAGRVPRPTIGALTGSRRELGLGVPLKGIVVSAIVVVFLDKF